MMSASLPHGLEAVAVLRRGKTNAHESDPVLPVHECHVEAILPHVSRHVAGMIRLQLTGMRSGEVCIMRGCDALSLSPTVRSSLQPLLVLISVGLGYF